MDEIEGLYRFMRRMTGGEAAGEAPQMTAEQEADYLASLPTVEEE